MISFKAIGSFRSRLADLLKVRRKVYTNVENEIKREFTDNAHSRFYCFRSMGRLMRRSGIWAGSVINYPNYCAHNVFHVFFYLRGLNQNIKPKTVS